MREEIVNTLKANFGPLVFLVVAGLLCMLLPIDSPERSTTLTLVIGAALTRVKRTDKS
jgi:hypothetical protein